MKKMIEITCYGQTEKHPASKRKELMDFYLEGVMCCEGSERDRYAKIYSELADGLFKVSDEWED